MDRIVVRAYSSSANLGPGYDALAVALDAYMDIVEARVSSEPGVRVAVEGEYARQAGGGATARRAVEELLKNLDPGLGVEIRINKGIPPGRGLGSSGASAAGAVAAVHLLLGSDLDMGRLVEVAGLGESEAAGTPHYDNVAASLLGGFTVISRGVGGGLRVVRLRPQSRPWFAVVTPMDPVPENKTRVMRSVLPESVPLADAVVNWSRLAVLVSGISYGDWSLVGEMMSGDIIVEPRRGPLIPCYNEVRSEALSAGALGFAISGAGPSMIALHDSRRGADAVLNAMLSACRWKVEPLGKVSTLASGAVEQGL